MTLHDGRTKVGAELGYKAGIYLAVTDDSTFAAKLMPIDPRLEGGWVKRVKFIDERISRRKKISWYAKSSEL